MTFELYPDTREYAPGDLQTTSLASLGNGQSAKLYAADRDGVIDLHFKWMSQYGIDGVALQRFLSDVTNNAAQKNLRDSVAFKVRKYAEKWGKSFYLEYDISGVNESSLVQDLENDWAYSVEPQIVNSPRYARHNGKPVIAIWGLGFTDRPGTQAQAQQIIQWFHNKGYYVIGGVPYNWRSQNLDSKAGWLSTYLQFDMIQPWSIGRYVNSDDVYNQYVQIHIPDKALCDQYGIQYQRVIFPGTSWSNWNGGTFNSVPRRGGDFMWKQGYYAAKLGATAFVAMFDEYDEGTAIAKAAEDSNMIPRDQNFLSLGVDGYSMSSDFYLRLTGEITKLFTSVGAYTTTIPISYR